ncbi:MAG: hypothetical protein KC561_05510, partial [Myxococcales bacterium]|nr:hypothetical protein [Myxococcales bacterium]
MASSEPQKILRVGVIQNGTFIEERLMRKPQPVTIGSNFKNTFAISAAGVPSTTVLFDCKGGEYTLQFDQNMSGRVAVGQRAHKLEDLRKDGRAEKKGELWILKLDQKSRGKVEVGDVIFLFQFVAPPPNRAAPQLPAAMRGGPFHFFVGTTGLTGAFGLILLLSLILQGGFITYLVLEVPPPPRPTGIGDLPDEIRLMLTERDEEPEEVEQPEPDEVEETEVSDEATEVAEVTNEPEPERAEPEPEPQPRIDPPAANREERLQVARERAQESSLFSALSTSDNGTGGAMDQVFNVSDRRLDTIMDRQAARGESALANAGAAGGSADPSGDSQTV